jgi:hypothetical protein
VGRCDMHGQDENVTVGDVGGVGDVGDVTDSRSVSFRVNGTICWVEVTR